MKRPSTVQSHLRFPLTYVLGNESSVRVLRALIAHGGPLSVAQLARESTLSLKGVRLALGSLASQQLVKTLGQPRSQLYTVDPQHPLSPALKELFAREQSRWEGLMQALRDVLQPLPAVEAAWLYGSVARGEDASRSDVDIAIVVADGDADSAAEIVRDALQPVEERYYASCSVVTLSRADVARLAAKGDDWWNSMTEVAKPLKGMSPVLYAKTLTK